MIGVPLPQLRHWRAALAGVVLSIAGVASAGSSARGDRPLTVDDVLDTVALEHAAYSSDRKWVSAVVQRPARSGEVFGRNAYEIDPSRNDIWLISVASAERRNLTGGAGSAAGFWCPVWSPDGRKLAMLSTKPEGREPRGGDNVRLYVWDSTTDALVRVSDTGVMTQTRYGSPLYALDFRSPDSGSRPVECASGNENAPFIWLDDHRLLAAMLPPGRVSGLLDAFGRPFDQSDATRAAIKAGTVTTVSVSGSGDAGVQPDKHAFEANLSVIDVNTKAVEYAAPVPAYPFQGALAVSIAPDRHQVAVLATTGALPLGTVSRPPHHDDAWEVQKRLGFLDLQAGSPMRWAKLPRRAALPLELLDWSPDSRQVALRARPEFKSATASLFLASATELSLTEAAVQLAVGTPAAGPDAHEAALFWIDEERLLVRGQISGSARLDWWLVSSASATNLTASLLAPPTEFRRASDNLLVSRSGSSLFVLDTTGGRLLPFSRQHVPTNATLEWPSSEGGSTSFLIVSEKTEARKLLTKVPISGGQRRHVGIAPEAQLLDVDAAGDMVLWREATRHGLYLRETSFTTGVTRTLLALDQHLAAVDWGRTMLIDYRTTAGQPMKAAVILPPGYKEGQRYPTLAWVYGGYIVHDLQDYWLDPYLPGIYNLQLYAAQGYVVLIPSMPLRRNAAHNESYDDLPDGVLPALDKLTALGIADPDRLGVIGQSFGGYSVYGLITQTKRFKAAVALAGISDLTSMYGQFDPTAQGYSGIEQMKSNNWSILEAGVGLGGPPYQNHDLYWRNSPLAYVDRVETPLLLVHGEHDQRGNMGQAEEFFFSLYSQGKTAKLLRYRGESHSLAQSPANVRSILDETSSWFERYLQAKPSTAVK